MDESKIPSMSAIEAVLIDLLGAGERFGLELVATSDGRVKRGSVYVTLSRMEAKGFVESRQEDRAAGAIGLPRRLYKATAYGATVRRAYQSLHEAIGLKPAEAR
jgi:DNA-binding PadR family transcriptional regulator